MFLSVCHRIHLMCQYIFKSDKLRGLVFESGFKGASLSKKVLTGKGWLFLDYYYAYYSLVTCRVNVILSDIILQGRGALQDLDQMSLFKPLCKYTATINHIREIVPKVKEALQQAQSGTPGE